MIVNLLLKFVSLDTVAKVMASCVVKLMEYARKKGGTAWDDAKVVAKSAERWLHLFNEVYHDDELTEAEEAQIVDAIKQLKVTKSIHDIIRT